MGFYWERGRLARRIWPISTATRNRRAFDASVVLLLIVQFLNTLAGEDARAPSEPLFSEQKYSVFTSKASFLEGQT